MRKATTYGNKMMVLDTETMTVSLFDVKDPREVFAAWEVSGEATETRQLPAERLEKFEDLWKSTGSRVL